MINGFIYTFANGSLTREPYVYAREDDITRAMARAHQQGEDHTAAWVQDIFNNYINFDPKNVIIQAWDEGNDFVTVPMEQEYPWLRYYLNDPEAPTPPVDDPSIREAKVAAAVEAFQRRIFKSQRAQNVAAIKVDVNGKVFDGDEVAQTRMTRAVNIAHAELLDQLMNYLSAQIGNTSITAHDLLTGMYNTLDQTKQALSTTWVLADNTPVTVTPDELKQACHQAMLAMESTWVPPESGS